MTKAKEVLDFLNSIEGAGYGGMASFEIARAHVKDMIAQPQSPLENIDSKNSRLLLMWMDRALKAEEALAAHSRPDRKCK